MDSSKKRARATNAAADLTDDLIVEILSRLPVKSICRFKCVCRHWHGLISHPEHRRNIPQTISVFFYPHCYLLKHEKEITAIPEFIRIRVTQEPPFLDPSLPFLSGYKHEKEITATIPEFISIRVTEEPPFLDPSLPFLSGYRSIRPTDCCGGLLLNMCWKVNPRDEFNYVVCNPAADKWMVLPEPPDNKTSVCAMRLGFDPAVSSHFHVFRVLEEDEYGYITGLEIYSSETGAWTHKGNGWGDEVVAVGERGVFMNGILHLMSLDFTILIVDKVGKTWRTIPLLESMSFENFYKGPVAFIGQSQGRLCYINTRRPLASKISVWILEGYSAGQWMFKYNVSTSQLCGEVDLMFERDYSLIGIHPECNVIFLVWKCEKLLMSYDMDRGKICVICTLTEPLGNEAFLQYFPYVPFFSDSLADQN